MASIDISNQSDGWLVLWLEPLGEDRWLQPGEDLRVESDYVGTETPFTICYWSNAKDAAAGIQNIECWVNHGDAYAEVRDSDGRSLECGYQRPPEVDARWTEQRLRGEERPSKSQTDQG